MDLCDLSFHSFHCTQVVLWTITKSVFPDVCTLFAFFLLGILDMTSEVLGRWTSMRGLYEYLHFSGQHNFAHFFCFITHFFRSAYLRIGSMPGFLLLTIPHP